MKPTSANRTDKADNKSALLLQFGQLCLVTAAFQHKELQRECD